MLASAVFKRTARVVWVFSILAAGSVTVPGIAAAQPTLYEKLMQVNRNWAYVGPEKREALEHPASLDESELLKKHLELVEYWLRKEEPAGLTPREKIARERNLQYLHDYWTKEESPRNYVLPHRNPVFIDQGDRVCAVGYLMVRGGRADLARALSKLDNKIYIREIRSAEFDAWVNESGLTVDELAWIQPAYGPQDAQEWEPVGQSLQGEVRTMLVDEMGNIYAGGNFQIRGSKGGPVNLAFYFGGLWRPVGGGVRGQVDALIIHENHLYVAGTFDQTSGRPASHLAVWDIGKNKWIPQAAAFDGRIRSFAVFQGTLFAGGDFKKIGSRELKHLAKWDAEKKAWLPAGSPDGPVLGLHVFTEKLIATGAFRQVDGNRSQFAASFSGKSWESMGEGLSRPTAVTAVFNDRLVFGNYEKREHKEAQGEKYCSLALPAWTGKAWEDLSAFESWECSTPAPSIGGLAAAGDALTIGLRDTGMLQFVVLSENRAQIFGGGTADTLTGLSKVHMLASANGKLFIGGVYDKNRDHYIGGSEIVSGKNVLLFYEFRSGLNRIDYSRIRGDTFYTPFRALNGIKEEE